MYSFLPLFSILDKAFADCWLVSRASDVGYTFPACNPVKRIDYIFVRNVSLNESAHANRKVKIHSIFLAGQEPTDDTSKCCFEFIFGIFVD